MITVRPAREGDIPAILELLVQVNMVHHRLRPDLFNGPTVKYHEGDLRLLLLDESAPIFVAEENGAVVGHCFCQLQQHSDPLFTPVKTLYIDDICVDEAARGRGIGHALYEHAVSYARSLDCYNVTLNVWAGNDALAFYESCGMSVQRTTMEQIL